jgi:pyroglutamyl-peptidase
MNQGCTMPSLSQKPRLLLTSFTTWLPHHTSNSSDDLLGIIQDINPLPDQLHFVRQLPVDFDQAPQLAIAQIEAIQPQAVVACGMAEERSRLSLESRAVIDEQVLTTPLCLDTLAEGLSITEISHDAGTFVCNATYHALLCHLSQPAPRPCLFVHVPLLTDERQNQVVQDFCQILQRIAHHSQNIGKINLNSKIENQP